MSEIRYYDSITRQVITIDVSDEVETYLKRSYWREDMQNRRYQKRKLLFDDALEYFNGDEEVDERIIKQLQITEMLEVLRELDPRSKMLLYYRYYKELSLRQVAAAVGISPSYAAKSISKSLDMLRKKMVQI